MEKQGAPILGRKVFLYLTSFFSGMSVMAIELAALADILNVSADWLLGREK